MKKRALHLLMLTTLSSLFTFAQNNNRGSLDVSKIYELADKLLQAKNYTAAFENLKSNAGSRLNYSDSLIYLKIRILENLYATNLSYTTDLDSSLKLFLVKVNRYSFSVVR